MFKIEINDFLGKNLKADSFDLNNHEAQTLDGFDISTKPGALIKRKGFTNQVGQGKNFYYSLNWFPEADPPEWHRVE